MNFYILQAENTNYYKIGKTSGSVYERMCSLQTGCPHKLKLVYKTEDNFFDIEKILHGLLSENCIRGEWFEMKNGYQEIVAQLCLWFQKYAI